MKRIGLISDTHGSLEEKVFRHFEDCDEIWHAGDIGSLELAAKLESYKPFKAVYGNIDDLSVRIKYPEIQIFEEEKIKILMIHIAGPPLKYTKQLRELLRLHQPNLLICGHSHILRVVSDKERNLLYINPGAAGKQGFHKIKTIMKFNLQEGQVINMKAIELGKRG